MFYGPATIDRITVGLWVKRGLPKQEKQSSVFCFAQIILSQPLVLKFRKLMLPPFVMIGSSEPDNWGCLRISNGNVGHIQYAGYLKVCARTVPWSRTVENQTVSKATSSELLARFEAEGDAFLSRLVRDTWAHHFEPETKGLSV
jgi:hypothetical protein